jgi:hypothetical protein
MIIFLKHVLSKQSLFATMISGSEKERERVMIDLPINRIDHILQFIRLIPMWQKLDFDAKKL